ncbi:hypothetical protein MNB_SV-13-871 [hydrothermal vent metagenome]|uniref:Uncharacterized protein n=1 Tax=hydrothermal vent metagenome TaxID=652676 RepID=A0A1W1D149_9ZZZZ
MHKIITFMLLFMLSFSMAHDSVISLLKHEKYPNISQINIDLTLDKSCEGFNEIHNMFHFMAIVTAIKTYYPHFPTNIILQTLTTQAPSPLQESAYKPPIV